MERMEHTYCDDLICPHCGYTYADIPESDLGGEGAMRCPSCRKRFTYRACMRIYYVSYPAPE